MGQNPYSQQSNQNPYNHQPYPQGDFNAYGSQSYPQGNSNVYGQQSNLQGEPSSYDQPSYIQTPVKVRSKMLFIIAGALIVILFLGGLAIGLISSNKSGTQANKNSQNAEQGDSSKTLVQNGDFDTVVTVKSKDIDNIKNELDKLKLYKLEEKVIDKDDIILLVDEDIDDTVFELVSSILKNDCNKAMKLYYNFINNGMDVSQIIAIIASQIRLLFQVKRLYNSGKSNEEIAKILEFKSPYRVKYLLNDCYYYSEDDLIKYLSKLADIDKNIKSGNGDGKFLLELFIAKKDM